MNDDTRHDGQRTAVVAAALIESTNAHSGPVRAYDPYADVPAEYRCDSVDELFAASGFVTLHLR